MVLIDLGTLVGSAAALCTTISYLPQLKKSWKTGETGDLSRKMLALLAVGLGLWMIYGFIKSDLVIIAANGISVAMVLCIFWIKLRGGSPASGHVRRQSY